MGATQSYLSPEAAVTAIVVAGAIGIGYTQFGQVESKPDSASPSNQTSTPVPAQPKKNKKKKKGGAAPAAATGQPDVPVSDDGAVSSTDQKPAALPNVIPGQFDASSPPPVDHTAAPASKPKKAKKKKAKAAGTGAGAATKLPAAATPASSDSESSSKPPQPEKKDQLASSSSSSKLTRPLQQSTISIDTDDSWTRVEPRRRQPAPLTTPAIVSTPADQLTTSDAGITSLTGTSSPVTDRTEDELSQHQSPNPRDSGENRRTLAEKLLPKPRKTGVDDMLETSDYPTIARTIRIQPPPDAKPVDGYSWGDYEDVQVSGGDAGGNDADGEDDGWGVVKSKKQPRKERPASAQPQSHTQKAPETLTKRQRQNASRREAEKEAKAALEAEQQAALANHRRELEKLRMAEQQQKEKKGTKVSGGMKASVDDNGRLVWE